MTIVGLEDMEFNRIDSSQNPNPNYKSLLAHDFEFSLDDYEQSVDVAAVNNIIFKHFLKYQNLV